MTFRFKIGLAVVAIQAAMFLVLIWSSLHMLHTSNEQAMIARATTTASLFAAMTKDAVLSTDLASLDAFVTRVLTSPEVVYARVRDRKRVLAQDGAPHVLTRVFVADTRFAKVNDRVFDTYAEITEAGVTFGRVELGLSIADMQTMFTYARWETLGIAVAELLVMTLCSFGLVGYLTRGLTSLRDATQRIAAGDLNYRIQDYGRDELAQTATAFNHMAHTLQCVYSELQDALRQAEANAADMHEKEAYLRAVLTHAIDGIITINEHGIIESCNRAIERLFGYSADEIIGQHVSILLAEPHRAMYDGSRGNAWHDCKAALIGSEREVEGQHKDGSTFSVTIALSEVCVEGQYFLIGIVRDTTERRQTEAALREAKDAAETAAKARSAFLATMSHEIRTPMNGVLGMTGLLLDTELTTKQRECAEVVRRSGESLLTIINDVLDFSKIEAGKLELEMIDFELQTTVDDVLELLAEKAHGKGLELVCLVHEDVPTWVVGDPGRLRQVLTNLVGNAVKFTDTGEIVVRVTVIEATDYETLIHFAVTDTGIGLLPEEQRRLFRPFAQADGSTTRKYGGTGLGLAISKQLVEMLGGTIGVESVHNGGSTFWFTVRLGCRQAQQTVSCSDTVDLHGVRVLCVDGNPTSRLALAGQLMAWGMQVTCAEDGPSTLAQLRAAQRKGENYALALLDIQLSGMDDMALAHTIKADASLASTHLILLTPFGQREYGKEARHADIAASVTKPVRQSQLFDCLITVMNTSPESNSSPLSSRRSLPEAQAQMHAKVLVAEDNIVNQKVARRMLEKLGCRVDVVANGQEAVDATAQIVYDCLIMDCQMPEMDGFEATAAIRRREAHSGCRLPIIAMTANAMQGDRARCLEAGMDDYISKPAKPEELLSKLQRWIRGTQLSHM